ncbi:polygalacturonase QRT3 isoform X2 [Sesamum indicum]|uniref:Polygalacturonase QRT3 isoform X2 n=1 Tax=Sesamum indicum TaxID=4182 RepID=A0A8M8VD54_SESIN|nr:polygalacturonase QRT3 isoform X2 [Sesamum indicum]
MATSTLPIFFFFMLSSGIITCMIVGVYGDHTAPHFSRKHSYHSHLPNLFLERDSASPIPPPAPASTPSSASPKPLVYHVTSYGADPTGKADSTDPILAAISDALKGPGNGFLMEGIVNLGGARVDLDGGNYLISRPIQFPVAGRGNLIHGGSLTASGDFPDNGYLIDLSPASNNGSGYNYEFVTLRDLFLDSNFRGGGIQVINSLRTNIDNCYITHFNTQGIQVQGGHETYIRYSYLGQHITAGGDPGERNFSGTAIALSGNDNSITDVVIFSAATGILISGQANTLSGVHCYNKATSFGGTGIYLKTPGLTQTRIVNSYLDFTGIVAEDPVQLTISSSFFLGDAYILFKSINGVVNGVNIVDNMFSGSDKGIEIVQLDQSNRAFNQIDQVVIDRNNVKGMKLKATVARGSVEGNGSSWTTDFNSVLVFPDLIKQVQYTFITNGRSFPVHALRNVSGNKIVIQSDVAVPASVHVTADQGGVGSFSS